MSSKIGFTLGVFFYLALPCIAGDTSLVYTGEVKSAFVVGQSVKLADEYASHDLTLRTGDSFVSIWLALPFTGVALDSRQWNHEFDASCGTSLSHVGLPGKIEVGTYQLAPLNRGDNEFLTASYSLPVGALSFTVQRMEGIGRESFKSGWLFDLGQDSRPPLHDRAQLAHVGSTLHEGKRHPVGSLFQGEGQVQTVFQGECRDRYFQARQVEALVIREHLSLDHDRVTTIRPDADDTQPHLAVV